MNNHVRAQALAFTRCKRLINSVVAGWQHPELAPHLDHDRRLDGLRSAIRAIAESTQGRGRRAAARPAQQPGAVPRTPAQERAIKEQIRGRKRDRRAQLLRVFEDLLRSRRPPA